MLLLHRRQKPADDWGTCIAHGPGNVAGLEDEVAGAAIGVEERGEPLVEQAEIALRLDFR